jgi:sulfite reductase (NADPH) flavoprotein alpha-component
VVSAPARAVLERASPYDLLSSCHGFLPCMPPSQSLPPSHQAWDTAAAQLPDLHRDLALRTALAELPVLDAGPAALPAEHLRRAAMLLTMLTHAYVHFDDRPALPPPALLTPWDEVSRQLGRPLRCMTVLDLVVCNWRLVDPDGPRTVANLQPLCVTVGNREQIVSWTSLVEALAVSAPTVSAAVRVQEAVLARDPDVLRDEFDRLRDVLDAVAAGPLAAINLHEAAPTHVDPVLWSRTVVGVASPVEEGVEQGPAGTGLPLFHLFDALLGRTRHDSRLGREMRAVRRSHPASWREFVDAVAAVPVGDHVTRHGGRALRAAWGELNAAYAGERGLLGRHRLKAAGVMDLGFRTGRAATVAGIAARDGEPGWYETDDALQDARRDRPPAAPPVSEVRVVEVQTQRCSGEVVHVALDVTGTGLRLAPGDCVAVLPRHDPPLVADTLRALRVDPAVPVRLDAAWRAAPALAGRDLPGGDLELPIGELLALGQIRQAPPATAQTLAALTHSQALAELVESHESSSLAGLLQLAAARGLDPGTLLTVPPGAREHLARLIPPEPARLYSALTAPSRRDELRLAVGRGGTCSDYLASLAPGDTVRLQLRRPTAFRMPPDPTVPVVLIAGGTGLAAFGALLAQRANAAEAGPTWLYLAARTAEDVLFADELAAAESAGRLRLRTALSRGEPARRIADVLAEPAEAAAIEGLLADPRAQLLVCGRPGFARAALDALARCLDGGAGRLRALAGAGRLHQEVFASGPLDTPRPIDRSEVARRDWTIIDGDVHDLTLFALLHPGGAALLDLYAGVDATAAYRRIGHDSDPAVHSQLGVYRIGTVRRLRFARAWSVAIGDRGLRHIELAELYRCWVRVVHRAVQLANTLAIDQRVARRGTVRGEQPGEPTAYTLRLTLDTHHRVREQLRAELLDAALPQLWALTTGAAATGEPASALTARLASGAPAPRDAPIRARLNRAGPARDEAALAAVRDDCAVLAAADLSLLDALAGVLLDGLRLFEQYEQHTLRDAGPALVAELARIPDLIEQDTARLDRELGGAPCRN